MDGLKLRVYTREKGKVLASSKSVSKVTRERPVSSNTPGNGKKDQSPSPTKKVLKSGGLGLSMNGNR
jgi:hypothetical protein